MTGSKHYSFFENVYDVVRLVPHGRVTSYGAIASYLGVKMSSRMVGWAMNGAHNVFPSVPAQRVVNRNGVLTGKHHFGEPDKMKSLLENEGHIIVNDTILNFRNVFWDPAKELQL